MSGITPSQTVGPFFAYGLTPNGKYDWVDTFSNNLITPDASGERIHVRGRVFDADDKPIPDCMIEIWQADAQGRYANPADQRSLPNAKFTGFGRCGADDNGDYSFDTIKPGPYPWRNHHNAWRPAHIHFSVFGHSFLSRLVTQMYFPGDPLFPFDPIYNSVSDEKARERMVSSFDLENTIPEWALCFRFDMVLRGRNQTPMEK